MTLHHDFECHPHFDVHEALDQLLCTLRIAVEEVQPHANTQGENGADQATQPARKQAYARGRGPNHPISSIDQHACTDLLAIIC